MINKNVLKLVGCFCLFLFLLACRYQTGFPLEKGTSVAISVENKSTAPQLGPILNRKIKEELLKAGVHSISKNPQKAQVRVRVCLENYSRIARAYQTNDTLLASAFELRLGVSVEVENKRKSSPISKFSLSPYSFAMRMNSLDHLSDRQALTQTASELAVNIVHRLSSEI